MNSNNRVVFYVIIFLLVTSASLGIYGMVLNYIGRSGNIVNPGGSGGSGGSGSGGSSGSGSGTGQGQTGTTTDPENKNHDFHFNNKLYFYNGGSLLGTYECSNDNCNYASPTIDDSKYSLNYYIKPISSPGDKTNEVNNKYAFLVDGDEDEVIIYDFVNKNVIEKIAAVKDYGLALNDNYVILKNSSGKWGIKKMDSSVSDVVDYKYDYIGVAKNIDSETKNLKSDLFVVKENDNWKIIDNTGEEKSDNMTNDIYDYTSKYIITKNITTNNYYLVDYENNQLIDEPLKELNFVAGLISVLNTDNQFYLFNPKTSGIVTEKIKVNSLDNVKIEVINNNINLSVLGDNGQINITVLGQEDEE